jgi:hypothetical protein
MSVSSYFGFTQSGKSYHVEKHVLPAWNKVIIYDHASCFEGTIVVNPTDTVLKNWFTRLSNMKNYRLVIRPSRISDDKALFDKTVLLACALGRCLGKIPDGERVQLVIDEADFICTPTYQSAQLKHLVNKGRHDNVDSHFIARNPNRLHTDIRANSSKIVTFQLTNAANLELFRGTFGNNFAKIITKLKKFHRLEWNETGEISLYSEQNKKIRI